MLATLEDRHRAENDQSCSSSIRSNARSSLVSCRFPVLDPSFYLKFGWCSNHTCQYTQAGFHPREMPQSQHDNRRGKQMSSDPEFGSGDTDNGWQYIFTPAPARRLVFCSSRVSSPVFILCSNTRPNSGMKPSLTLIFFLTIVLWTPFGAALTPDEESAQAAKLASLIPQIPPCAVSRFPLSIDNIHIGSGVQNFLIEWS